MELIRTSVICCALARAWGALAAAWRSSALCRGLTAFFDDILLRWASGSVICRWFSKDGWMGPAWRTSLFGRLVTWVANLIPSILHWIYRRAKGLFDGSLFCRLTYAIGDQTAVLTSWVVLAILVVTALLHPTDRITDMTPSAAYATAPFFAGFLEGYNTMDALASLAFGIVVINVIRGLGVTEPGAIAKNTVLSGIFSCLFMGGIYVAVTIVGAQSHSLTVSCTNGGEAFAVIAEHYLGRAGLVVLALTVILACLKTSIGLVTSCAETFTAMFPNGPKYGFWATCFSIFSLLVTNIGLNAIIAISLPVLMFLFPLAITLILLALLGNLYGHDTVVYRWVTGFTLAAALFDFVKALPKAITETPAVSAVIGFADSYLPFFELGLGWICPAAVGLFVGLIFHRTRRNRPAA